MNTRSIRYLCGNHRWHTVSGTNRTSEESLRAKRTRSCNLSELPARQTAPDCRRGLLIDDGEEAVTALDVLKRKPRATWSPSDSAWVVRSLLRNWKVLLASGVG